MPVRNHHGPVVGTYNNTPVPSPAPSSGHHQPRKSKHSKSGEKKKKSFDGYKVKQKKAKERREKSRVAAQIRRNRESQALILLQNALPISRLPQSLEKSGIIRIASHTLCLFNNFSQFFGVSSETPSRSLRSKSVIGLIFDNEKNLVFAPPSLADITGQHWTSLVGMPHYDLIEGSTLPDTDKTIRLKLSGVRSRTFFNGAVTSMPTRTMLGLCWCSIPLKASPASRALNLPNGPSPLTFCLIQPLESPPAVSLPDEDSDPVVLDNSVESAPLGRAPGPEQQATVFRTFHDRALVTCRADENCSKCIGYTSDDLVGQTLYDLVHLDDIQLLKSNLQALESQEVLITKFYRLRTLSDDFRWARSTLLLSKQDRRYTYICKHEVAHIHFAPDNYEHVMSPNLVRLPNRHSTPFSHVSSGPVFCSPSLSVRRELVRTNNYPLLSDDSESTALDQNIENAENPLDIIAPLLDQLDAFNVRHSSNSSVMSDTSCQDNDDDDYDEANDSDATLEDVTTDMRIVANRPSTSRHTPSTSSLSTMTFSSGSRMSSSHNVLESPTHLLCTEKFEPLFDPQPPVTSISDIQECLKADFYGYKMEKEKSVNDVPLRDYVSLGQRAPKIDTEYIDDWSGLVSPNVSRKRSFINIPATPQSHQDQQIFHRKQYSVTNQPPHHQGGSNERVTVRHINTGSIRQAPALPTTGSIRQAPVHDPMLCQSTLYPPTNINVNSSAPSQLGSRSWVDTNSDKKAKENLRRSRSVVQSCPIRWNQQDASSQFRPPITTSCGTIIVTTSPVSSSQRQFALRQPPVSSQTPTHSPTQSVRALGPCSVVHVGGPRRQYATPSNIMYYNPNSSGSHNFQSSPTLSRITTKMVSPKNRATSSVSSAPPPNKVTFRKRSLTMDPRSTPIHVSSLSRLPTFPSNFDNHTIQIKRTKYEEPVYSEPQCYTKPNNSRKTSELRLCFDSPASSPLTNFSEGILSSDSSPSISDVFTMFPTSSDLSECLLDEDDLMSWSDPFSFPAASELISPSQTSSSRTESTSLPVIEYDDSDSELPELFGPFLSTSVAMPSSPIVSRSRSRQQSQIPYPPTCRSVSLATHCVSERRTSIPEDCSSLYLGCADLVDSIVNGEDDSLLWNPFSLNSAASPSF